MNYKPATIACRITSTYGADLIFQTTETTPQYLSLKPNWQHLQLKDVSLRYGTSSSWVVHGLDMKLIRGECIALVGASGSGKTTLAALLLGLMTPQEGQLLLDGVALDPTAMPTWQKQCAEVLQQPKLVRGTLRANLSGWSEPSGNDLIWQALSR